MVASSCTSDGIFMFYVPYCCFLFPQNNLGKEGQLDFVIPCIIALNLTVSFGSPCLLLSMEFSHGEIVGGAYFSVLHLYSFIPALHGPVYVNTLLLFICGVEMEHSSV